MRRFVLGSACLIGVGALASAQTQSQKILPAGGIAFDYFGRDFDVVGSLALVGCYGDNDLGINAGSVIVLENDGLAWLETAELHASDGAAGDEFGVNLACDGATLVVGAWKDDDQGGDSGSAYVFEQVAGTWVQIAKLKPANGRPRDYFGKSVSVVGDTIVVGASHRDLTGPDAGAVFVFTRVAGAWIQTQQITASDPGGGDWFGRVAVLSEDASWLFAGTHYDDDVATNSGAVYALQLQGATYVQVQKLKASDAGSGDIFGKWIDVSGTTLLVGSWMDDDLGGDAGSAYVFDWVGGVWTQSQKLLASDGRAGDLFGKSVAIEGDRLVVGAYLADVLAQTNSGAVYLFERQAGAFMQTNKVVPEDGQAFDGFGFGVFLTADQLFTGAIYDDDLGIDSGSFYVFDLF
jgi:hypothetical protein